jgi:SAM-dependent methyltransferase
MSSFPPEDVSGTLKCLRFASSIVAERRPARVLDFGCGTGDKVTCPLATAYPEVQFVGVDVDRQSVEYARRACSAPNARFIEQRELGDAERFDLVVASEVVEHVESPVAFLRALRERLSPDGRIFLTVPNGYGPSEVASSLETVAALAGVLGLARAVKRALVGRSAHAPVTPDTLAVSPHISFFTWRELERILSAAGLAVERYQARTVMCGFGFDLLMRGPRTVAWNARTADRLPRGAVSGWMLLLSPDRPAATDYEHVRGPLARVRRWLNEKRWGLR